MEKDKPVVIRDRNHSLHYEEQPPSRTIISISREGGMAEQDMSNIRELGECLAKHYEVKWDKDRVRLFVQKKDHTCPATSELKADVDSCIEKM
jgi:hypothetical protein